MNKVQINELETADYDLFENIKTALYRLWKNKIIVVISTLMAVCICLIYVGIVGIQTTYYTTATIYSVVYGSSTDSYTGVTLMNNYSDLISSSRVCERAANSLSSYGITTSELQSMAKSGYIYLSGASTKSNSYGYKLILYVRSSSPENIRVIANAMAAAYANELNDISGSASLQVMDEAQNILSARSLSIKAYLLIFAAVGFVLSSALIFVVEFLSSKVYSVGQCEGNKDLILGIVPMSK